MQVKEKGANPAGSGEPSVPSKVVDSGFGSRRVRSRAGFSFFRQRGHNRLVASLRALYNFTIAGLFSKVCYVARSKDGQPLVSLSRLPTKEFDKANADIQAACKQELTEHSYHADKHKGAIFIIESEGTEVNGHLEGYQLMHYLGIHGATEATGAKGCSIDVTKDRKLPCYQLDLSNKVDNGEERDWPLKINNAGACLISVPIELNEKFHEYAARITKIIRQLPPDKNGLPDMSKVRFMLTYANKVRDQIFDDDSNDHDCNKKKENYKQYLDQFKTLIINLLNKNFEGMIDNNIPSKNFMLVGDKNSTYLTPPDSIRKQLAEMTAETE